MWIRFQPPAIIFTSGGLPLEILDKILRNNTDPAWTDLLVCKYWYSSLIKRRVHSLHISTTMALGISELSKAFLDVLCCSTMHLNVRLHGAMANRHEVETFCISNPRRASPSNKVNDALRRLAGLLPSFHSLESFTLCNYLETEASWGVIWLSTFEHLLVGLSACRLQYVRLDMPGAPLENRLQLLYWPEVPKRSHVCDIIAQHFPDTRVFHLRMRELCPDVFKLNRSASRLEKLVVHLELEPAPWQELDLDGCVVDCRHSERLGECLAYELQPAAITFYGLAPRIQPLEFTYPINWNDQKERKIKKHQITL